jgi:hypothetical protein
MAALLPARLRIIPLAGGDFVAAASCKRVVGGELESTVVDVVVPRTVEDRDMSPQSPGSQRTGIHPRPFSREVKTERCS